MSNWTPEELEAGRPPERISVSEWARRYRVLSNAAQKGPYQTGMVPHLVEIQDLATVTDVEQIVLCKPAQLGGTDAILNIVGYYTHQDPSPIMLCLADSDTAITEMGRRRLQPMFRDSPDLYKIIDSDNWTKQEMFFLNGGRITLGWASSVARLASRPYRIVVFDEVDKEGYNLSSKEADPISLGKERTNTFLDKLIIILSTPTIETGRIWSELNACDVIFDWHVPCPHCGQFQPLRWSLQYASGIVDGKYRSDDGTYRDIGGVVWDGGREATRDQISDARYQCGECGCLWTTAEKNKAVQQGKMVPRNPLSGQERKVGFHLNRLYSLFPGGRLDNLVSDWIEAVRSNNPKQIQGFINSSLAEPWKQVVVETRESSILQARTDLPSQTVPEDAIVLTCGIDNQLYGFWYVVRAWAKDFTSWLIDYGHLPSWQELEDLLFDMQYPIRDSDKKMPIWRAGLDTGGGAQDGGMSMTEESYMWIRQNGVGRGPRVWGTKGASSAMSTKIQAGKPLDKAPSGRPLPGGLTIISLNTWALKDLYHYRLAQATQDEPGPQAAYLHNEVGEDYARQIKAEEKRLTQKNREEWVQVGKDNHLFDAEIICHALVDPEWPGGGIQLLRSPQDKEQQAGGTKNPRPNRRRENPYTGGRNPLADNKPSWFTSGRR